MINELIFISHRWEPNNFTLRILITYSINNNINNNNNSNNDNNNKVERRKRHDN